MPWHPRCDDNDCNYRCRRAGCAEPGVHFMARAHREGAGFVGEHLYDCTVRASLARQAVEELRPGMEPDEIAIARRVLIEALDRLERPERQDQTPRPTIYRASA